MPDPIYLCATDTLLQQYYGDKIKELKDKAKNGASIGDFSRLPFCLLNNRIGDNIKKCFDEAGFSPKVYSTSAYLQISNSICFQGLATCFATRTSLHNLRGMIPDNVNIFPLHYGGEPMIQHSALIYHKDRYLSHYNQYFFDLILNYFRRLEQLPLDQLVASELKDYY